MSSSDDSGQGQATKKRKKLSFSNAPIPNADGTAFSSKLVRSDIWFEDGNVILQTSNKMYRVHRGMLSMHSTVFRDMFGVPQPTDQPGIDGCTVIFLSDSVEDWDEFLPMLYNKRSAFQLRGNSLMGSYAVPTKLLLAMLVLGHKYDFRAFWNQALQFLKISFPTKLDDLEEFWFGKTDDDWFAYEQILQHKFRIIHVATELGIQTVLPAAYYICVANSLASDILVGVDKPGGPVYLTYRVRHTLIIGREWIQEQTLRAIFSWSGIKPKCPTNDRCQRRFMAWFGGLVAQATFWILMALSWDVNITRKDLCEMCYRNFESHFKDARNTIFLELPKNFGLPNWDALKDAA